MATVATTASTERLSSFNPATGELVGTVPIHTQVDIDATVARARIAAQQWASRSFEARAEEL
ncbi:MAG: aldehyde dehydrogenase family protein, partial [Deltaproteobacteria bacterium]|nr:aldehyde dehydrogenase family protein [Deltaproteobacteria bacterium]